MKKNTEENKNYDAKEYNSMNAELIERNTVYHKIHVEKYISKDKTAVKKILDSVKSNKIILITGAMGIGKTYFVTNDLLRYARSIGKKIVLVIPGVAQLENLELNKGIPVVYADLSYLNSNIVAVTPDSLIKKVICNLPINDFILIIDEAHQKILDSNFRKAFANIDIAVKTAYKIIYITATPRVLKNVNFNDVIEVTTSNPISNEIMLKSIDNKNNKCNLMDVKLSIIKESLTKYDNIIFFQNDIKSNIDMADLLAKGQNITKNIYKNNYQYSICLTNNECKDYVKKTTWEWITKTQTIQSGKENKEAKEGLLTANITFVTSVITAGIDLRVPAGNSSLLIIDATQRFDIDSIIQLIGRFRDGINVLILIKPRIDNKNEHFYKSFEDILNGCLNLNNDIANVYNKNNVKIEFYKTDLGINCLEYDGEANLYSINLAKTTEKAYSIWNKLLMYNIPQFIYLLKQQTAFKVSGEIEECSWLKEKLQVGEEIKKLKAARKEEFSEILNKMLIFEDKIILAGITKKYDDMEPVQAVIAKKYHELKSNSYLEHLKTVGELYINKNEQEEVIDIVKAFRRVATTSWSKIQDEIDDRDSRLINKDLKNNVIETFLDLDLYKIRTQKREQQYKIRFELRELEKNQGRLSDKIIHIITKKMIEDGYLRNQNTKVYCNINESIDERTIAFTQEEKNVIRMVERIYNITKDRRISSVKY